MAEREIGKSKLDRQLGELYARAPALARIIGQHRVTVSEPSWFQGGGRGVGILLFVALSMVVRLASCPSACWSRMFWSS